MFIRKIGMVFRDPADISRIPIREIVVEVL